ncbi:MAG: hypothetical protein LBD29_06130 [Treponema sp.]|jgi:hypothetical protein|nr:hypothetical protein [Treponema sp.]
MSFRKSLLISAFFSLGFTAFMVALVIKNIPMKIQEGYAALAVDASYPDRLIGDGISQALAKAYLSESTQWVFLDDFGTLEQIPLDKYEDRLEDFDPRNDGYGEKLRAFFVRDGKRLFFIPFSGPSWRGLSVSDNWINKKQTQQFEASLSADLGDIPFSIIFLGYEQPLLYYFLLFVLASIGALILSNAPLFTATILPVLGVLVWTGPGGLALGTGLIGGSHILMTLIRQLWSRSMNRAVFAFGLGSLLCLISLGLWTALFWNIPGVFSPDREGMPGLTDRNTLIQIGIPAALGVFCLLALAFWTESNRTPPAVYLLASSHKRASSGVILPFALVSLTALSPLIERTYHAPGPLADPRCFVNAEDYTKHLDFQRSFSFIPLRLSNADEQNKLSYTQYVLGEDGLITQSAELGSEDYYYKKAEIPLFPLEDLIAFLRDFKHTDTQDTGLVFMIIMKVLIPVLLVLGEYMMIVQIRPQREKKTFLVYNDKRIAA